MRWIKYLLLCKVKSTQQEMKNMKHLLVAVACAFVALESSAVTCEGCKARSNPGARYCFNCGKKMPAPETLEEKYEALMREAMPTVLAMQMTSEADIGLKTEEIIRSEMTKFRRMNPSRQKQEFENAQKAMSAVPMSAKALTGALRATTKKAESDEESFLLAQKGRNLVVAVKAANAEREAAGLSSVWPRSLNSLGADKDDISGVLFKNSSDYFRELLDMKNIGKGSWMPYVDVDWQIAIPRGASRAQWIVARGVTDEVPDNIPVLVSSNVDPASLVTAPGRHSGNWLDGALRFSGEWAVVVRKDGDTIVVTPKRASLSLIYKNQDFILPKDFGYLEP